MNAVSLLKFFATLLITNSHFGLLYPKGYEFLATGGTVGNSIFFFLSGYVLNFSNKDSNVKWILKRYLRVIIPIWIFNILLVIIGDSVKPISFLYPQYWFLQAIIVFYPLFLLISKYLKKYILQSIFVVLTIYVLFFFYNTHNVWIVEITSNPTKLHWIYYFSLMLFGAYIASLAINNDRKNQKKMNKLNIFFLLISIALYYLFKYIIISRTLFDFQFLLPLFLFLICYFSFITIKNSNVERLNSKIVLKISELTLEIYIVQFLIIRFTEKLLFPFGLITSVVLILLASFLLNYLTIKIKNVLFSLLRIS